MRPVSRVDDRSPRAGVAVFTSRRRLNATMLGVLERHRLYLAPDEAKSIAFALGTDRAAQ